MGFLNFLKKREKKTEIRYVTPTQMEDLLFFDNSYIPLNKHPDVLIAVDKIADLVSNMTIQLMENTGNGDVRIKNKLARKIDIEPYRYMTRKNWIYKIVKDLLLDGDGNSVVHVGTIQDTELIGELMPLNMRSVRFVDNPNDDGYQIEYGSVTLSPDEVIHFAMNPNPSRPHIGTGYRITLRDIADNLTQASKTKKSFMRNKNIPSLVVSVNGDTEELTTEKGKTAIKNSYLSSAQAGDPWIIPAEMIKVEQVKPLTLKDIAINESVEIDKKTIAGLIGVPAFFLGVDKFDKEEYNNFINTRILSISLIISQTLTRDLITSENKYFRLNPRSLYSYNITELVSAGTQMVQIASLRRNELRDWMGLPPDAEMNEIIVLENYLPQKDLGNQKKLKGGENDDE
ncbi:phage portal protein [Granulicatella adiacens]